MKQKSSQLNFNLWLMVVGWTLVLVTSFLIGKTQQEKHLMEVATAEANTHFERDLALRKWSAGHGGVYVPVSDRTGPNPNLAHIPDRDFASPSGKMMTLMNPAYMIRQVNEDLDRLEGSRTRITSLKPIRQGNAPDAWERQALQKLEAGRTEISEIVAGMQGDELRFMRPLFVEEGCLKCHAAQGYKVGDVRGGVGVTVPLDMLQSVTREANTLHFWIHLGLWGLGILGLIISSKVLDRGLKEQNQLAEKLELALKSTDAIIDNVPFGIIIVGKDKIVRRTNRTALEILGKNADEVEGRICHENICPAQLESCPVLDEHLELDNSPREALGPGNIRIPILKTVIPFTSDGEDVLLEAFIDTTEQTRKNNELIKTVDELQRFNRLAVGRELRMAGLKDEVNNLLTELQRQPRYQSREQTSVGGPK